VTRRVIRRHEGLSRERVTIGQQALHLQIQGWTGWTASHIFVIVVVLRGHSFLQPAERDVTAKLLWELHVTYYKIVVIEESLVSVDAHGDPLGHASR